MTAIDGLDPDAVKAGLAIAAALMTVNTDFRGDALKVAAIKLGYDSQGFTSKIMFDAAKAYGISERPRR